MLPTVTDVFEKCERIAYYNWPEDKWIQYNKELNLFDWSDGSRTGMSFDHSFPSGWLLFNHPDRTSPESGTLYAKALATADMLVAVNRIAMYAHAAKKASK